MLTRDLSGTVRIGSDTGPAKQQVKFWIRSGPVPERSRVNRRPIRSENRTGSVRDRSRVNIALLILQQAREILDCEQSSYFLQILRARTRASRNEEIMQNRGKTRGEWGRGSRRLPLAHHTRQLTNFSLKLRRKRLLAV